MRNQTLDDELKEIILSDGVYRYSWDIFHPLDFRYVSVSGGVVITNQRIIARTEEYLWLDYQGWMSISTN